MANQLKMAMIDAIFTLHQRNWSIRRIAKELGLHRDTVARHVHLFQQGAKPAKAPLGSPEERTLCPEPKPATPEGGAPTPEPATPEGAPIGAPTPADEASRQTSLCEPWRQHILEKLAAGLTAQRIYQDLVREHGFPGRYPSVRRFVRRLSQAPPLPFRRMECAPGEEAQVDFGTGIPIQPAQGPRRRTHVFRIILSHSRKGYSEVVYRQTAEEFIRCLENAFWHFGGVPKTLVLDNLKAGVLQPDWFDPDLNPKLQAFAQHYHVVLWPTRPATPRHKGKIESGVGYVKDNALRGHVFTSLDEENRHLLDWETHVADQRIHGTIREQVGKVFKDREYPCLQPLPLERFPFFHEGQRVVHRDGHVEVAKAYYSVPPEYLGRRVWVRWDGRLVRIFNQQLQALIVHPQREPGRFSTHPSHIPAEKVSGVERGATWLLTQVRRIGPQASRWAEGVLQERGIAGVRVLQGLLSLAKRYAGAALEQACASAASHGAYRLRAVRALLKRQAPPQELLPFMDAHPLIRDLGDYARFVHEALRQGAAP